MPHGSRFLPYVSVPFAQVLGNFVSTVCPTLDPRTTLDLGRRHLYVSKHHYLSQSLFRLKLLHATPCHDHPVINTICGNAADTGPGEAGFLP